MPIQDLKQRIHSALEILKSEEVRTNNDYNYKWHSGMKTFDLLQNLERIRNKQIELEAALKIIEEYS